MCIYYRKLNSITKAFEYSISRCDYVVTVVITRFSVMWIITVNTHQGYHQISVKNQTVKKIFLCP